MEHAFYDYENAPKEEWNVAEFLVERVDASPDRVSMKQANPKYVLRNWMAQLAIDAAEKEDYSVCEELFELLKNPYDEQPEFEEKWFKKRPEWARNRVGCSMLSCSVNRFFLEATCHIYPACCLYKRLKSPLNIIVSDLLGGES